MTETSICDFEKTIALLQARHEALLKQTDAEHPEIIAHYNADEQLRELLSSIQTRFKQMKLITEQVLYIPSGRKS